QAAFYFYRGEIGNDVGRSAYESIPGRRRAAVAYHFGNAALLPAASLEGACPGQRFLPSVFSARDPRSQRGPDHVCDCAKNGTYHGGGERPGRATRKSRLRHAFECAGGPP